MDAQDPLMGGVDCAYGCDRGDLPRGGGAVAARRGGLACTAAVGVLLAGCSSSGPKALPTTTIVSGVASTKAGTVAPTAVTTVVPTSTSTTTTLAPTTTTTVDPKVTAEADVRAAVKVMMDSFSACLSALPSCEANSLAVARSGSLLARNKARIADWNSRGYAVRSRDQFRWVIDSVVLDDTASMANAVVCFADGSRLVRPGAAPDGSDVVIDDSFGSARDEWLLRREADGVFRAYESTSIGTISASDVCGG